ncbi:MAG: sigma-54 dependent transcriptional regulator [Smithellaceae bacterium]|nr:sigma-54 dependent transcriptional regulator [Smithellaceae bacterium]
MMEKISILIVDDEPAIREGLGRIFTKEGLFVETSPSGQDAIECIQKRDFDLVITDLKMPGISGIEVLKSIKILQPDVPVIIITGYSTIPSAVEAMKNGAADYIAKPFAADQIIQKAQEALSQKKDSPEARHLRDELQLRRGFDRFIGDSKEMEKVYSRIIQVAPTDSTVLVRGETGTGKELVALSIHKHSLRQDGPFVAVDCTSLAEQLLESELFGHVRGSFTGAVQTKMGLFKVADRGTLFLDEVANISLTTQAKLLRVLQEKVITPIGSTSPQPVDIRLIAATNRNLKEMIAQETFREDLYFRLNVIPIELPPLRDRKGDIPLLIKHFMKKYADDLGKSSQEMAPDALALLESYNYPGNVRELENLIERAVVLCTGEIIVKENLELHEGKDDAGKRSPVPYNLEELNEAKRLIRGTTIDALERSFVLNALERNNWNISRAALETGMLRPNFQALMKRLGVSVKPPADDMP